MLHSLFDAFGDSAETPNIVIIGDVSQAGTYILWIHLKEQVSLRFGRFKGGKMISLPASSYIYVGSALAEKGPASLARRLIRHATRSQNKPPHRIRNIMIRQFTEQGLGIGALLPKQGKTLYWNVDFLLDFQAAEIAGLIAIRSPERLEHRFAGWFMAAPYTQVIERGLGANDTPGNTHLLRVCADRVCGRSFLKNVVRTLNGNV